MFLWKLYRRGRGSDRKLELEFGNVNNYLKFVIWQWVIYNNVANYSSIFLLQKMLIFNNIYTLNKITSEKDNTCEKLKNENKNNLKVFYIIFILIFLLPLHYRTLQLKKNILSF